MRFYTEIGHDYQGKNNAWIFADGQLYISEKSEGHNSFVFTISGDPERLSPSPCGRICHDTKRISLANYGWGESPTLFRRAEMAEKMLLSKYPDYVLHKFGIFAERK